MKDKLAIDSLIGSVGRWVSYVNLLLILLICVDVLLRYAFSFSKNWILELEWHLFALIFLLGASYTFLEDKHVRVDVFYHKYNRKKKAWLNLIGILLLLIPWCYVIITTSVGFALNSWYIEESSPNPGGLPSRYLIKSVIPISFLLLLAVGINVAIAKIKEIKK